MKFKETYKYINPAEYINIFSNPQWYLDIQPELKEFFYDYDGNRENKSQEWLEKRNEFIKMVCELLEAGKIALGDSGVNWDKERLSIDTIVIHHTSTPSDTPIIAIDALGLIRLYTPNYNKKDEKQFGQPIWSNHFYKNQQTFIAYHYVIRQDGSFDNILQDNQIGWHCGNWNYNCRSIAICFLDDLKEKRPTEKALQTANEIIKKYPNCNIVGHREIKSTTTCPGNLFLGKEGWKNDVFLKPQNN
ncbi:MAG: N-acetylmuramoyl-L-alanine amidase [Candidatus Kerfeldbacteria bacterium]|nr:N-acetylmuramoyl-L-alanine amidase [Candidatus Kerfeldbacteria bacterium]